MYTIYYIYNILNLTTFYFLRNYIIYKYINMEEVEDKES